MVRLVLIGQLSPLSNNDLSAEIGILVLSSDHLFNLFTLGHSQSTDPLILKEGQQVGVNLILVSRTEAVGRAGIDFQC
jgi:hypothetical protein